MTGVIHDLKSSPYTFTTDPGKFTTRFKLRYQDHIETGTDKIAHSVVNEKVLVYSNENSVTVYSFSEKITNVNVYDLLGRKIDSSFNINNQEFKIDLANLIHQPLIIKVTLANYEIVTKKIVF